MATTTTDQLYALLQGVSSQLAAVAAQAAANGSKLDTLLPEMRLVMALQDDLAAATVTLQDETASLQDSNTKLAQVLADLQAAVAANAPVDPAVVTAFEAALGQHQTSVDAIAGLVPPAAAPAGQQAAPAGQQPAGTPNLLGGPAPGQQAAGQPLQPPGQPPTA